MFACVKHACTHAQEHARANTDKNAQIHLHDVGVDEFRKGHEACACFSVVKRKRLIATRTHILRVATGRLVGMPKHRPLSSFIQFEGQSDGVEGFLGVFKATYISVEKA
jgi:hypothetical protein